MSFLSFRVIFHFHDYGRKGTLPKTNIAPKNDGWEDDFPLTKGGTFSGAMLVCRRVNISNISICKTSRNKKTKSKRSIISTQGKITYPTDESHRVLKKKWQVDPAWMCRWKWMDQWCSDQWVISPQGIHTPFGK